MGRLPSSEGVTNVFRWSGSYRLTSSSIMGCLHKLASWKFKHFLLLFVILVSLLFSINRVATIQKVKVLLSSMVQPIICSVSDIPREKRELSICPPKSDSPGAGCILPPERGRASTALGVTWRDVVCCSFFEKEMYTLFDEFIKEGDTVLEVGGRYGTVTCSLASSLGNSGNLATVEADPDVWWVLQHNLASHSCKAHLVLGVM